MDKVDKVDKSRLQPRISSTIQELQKRVGGGSGKKKRGRPEKVQPELPQCFPRIDKIITAMGGRKTKRKRAKDDVEECLPAKKTVTGNEFYEPDDLFC